MDSQAAAQAYKQAALENAPPIKIVRMLFEGALRFLEQASREDAADGNSRYLYYVGRVDAIVTELRLAIDHSYDALLTDNLERLYLFCETELGQASLDRDPSRLDGVRRVLETLLSAWREVEVQSEYS